jgi:hypothetical protein
MSVSETKAVRHYIIQRSGPNTFVLSENQFSDLVQLIAFYRVHILDTAALTLPIPFEEALKNGVQIRAYHSTTRAKVTSPDAFPLYYCLTPCVCVRACVRACACVWCQCRPRASSYTGVMLLFSSVALKSHATPLTHWVLPFCSSILTLGTTKTCRFTRGRCSTLSRSMSQSGGGHSHKRHYKLVSFP